MCRTQLGDDCELYIVQHTTNKLVPPPNRLPDSGLCISRSSVTIYTRIIVVYDGQALIIAQGI